MLRAPREPMYDAIKRSIRLHFDEPFEHVTVLYENRRADMFVGTASSMFSRVCLHLIHARLGVIPPFVFVDEQPFCPVRDYSEEHLCQDP